MIAYNKHQCINHFLSRAETNCNNNCISHFIPMCYYVRNDFNIIWHYSNYEIKCLSNLLQLEPCNDMFKVISDIIPHWYDLWNTIVIAIYFFNGKKMICALMFIICNHYGIKCFSNLFKFIINNHFGIKCLRKMLQLEQCNIMFNVIFDIMAHWYDMWNTIVIAINFCNSKKMNCALMFIMSNLYERKSLSDLLQLEPCSDMLKMIFHIMVHWCNMLNTFMIAIIWCNSKKLNCALFNFISNHYGVIVIYYS